MNAAFARLLPVSGRAACCAALVCVCAGAARGADEISIVSLTANAIAYDPVSQRIYASVPGNAPMMPNSLAVIDPARARVESSLFIGSEPGQIAVSGGGKYVWVSFGPTIRRYDIATRKAGALVSIGGGAGAEEIHPVPGNPEALLIVKAAGGRSPRFDGLAILENGTLKPAGGYGNTFAFGAFGARAYGYNNEISSFEFILMRYTRGGLVGLASIHGLIGGYGPRIRSENGLIIVDGVTLIDPESRTVLGNFAVRSGVYVPDATVGRVFHAVAENGQIKITASDMRTFLPVGSISISNVKGGPASLVRWGDNGLAFHTTEGQLVLVRTSLVPPRAPGVDLAVRRSPLSLPLKAEQPVEYTLTVSNVGAVRATGVALTDRLPPDVSVLDMKSSQGEVTVRDGILRASIDELGPKKSVTVRVSIQPNREVPADPVTFDAIVRADQHDTNPANNSSPEPGRELVPAPLPAPEKPAQPAVTVQPKPAGQPAPAAPRPVAGIDLTGEWKSVEQETTGAGVDLQATLNGVFVVRNAGTKPAPRCKVRFSLTYAGGSGLEEELLQEAMVPALAPGKTVAIRLKARLAVGRSAIGQVVTANIDPVQSLTDASRENNLLRSKPIP